jgi:hypothetical protein
MSRIGISYDDVLEAIASLEKQGDTPTIDKIRSFLGETGSNSTISKYLRVYRNKYYLNNHTNTSKNSPTPDIVQQAVERVWQDMRGQTDQEILTIKTEAQKLVDDAKNKAHHAETNFNDLKAKHDELAGFYQAERAQKELLILDIKKLHEEHTLLQERSKALETRYAEMQSLTSQHLTDLSNAHKGEVIRLEEAVKLQLESHTKLVSTIRDHSEQERHRNIVLIENLKSENKISNESIQKLQSQLQDNFSNMKKLEANLRVITVEKDEALNRLNEQDKKWSYFSDKTIVSKDIINKIYDQPKIKNLFDDVIIYFDKSFDKKFIELKKTFKYSSFKNTDKVIKEDQDE